jgi:hypothetical protein
MRFSFLTVTAVVSTLAATVFHSSSANSQDGRQRGPKSQQTSPFQEKAPPKQSKEELEKKFEEALSGATLKGHYTTGRNNNGGPAKEDKYTIESVTKLSGDMFLFRVKIQYAGASAVVPLPLRVLWAGDTPVITLDKLSIPGFGTFTARVMFFDGQYTGTWDGGNHGGVLFGSYGKDAPKDAAKKAGKDAADAERAK